MTLAEAIGPETSTTDALGQFKELLSPEMRPAVDQVTDRLRDQPDIADDISSVRVYAEESFVKLHVIDYGPQDISRAALAALLQRNKK